MFLYRYLPPNIALKQYYIRRLIIIILPTRFHTSNQYSILPKAKNAFVNSRYEYVNMKYKSNVYLQLLLTLKHVRIIIY